MKFLNNKKKNCNIFIPRTIYSIILILSQKNLNQYDNYILYNRNFRLPKELIPFLEKKKFKIIYAPEMHIIKSKNILHNNFVYKILKINFFKILINLSNELLKIDYKEILNIDLKIYNEINIYYSSNKFYFSKLINKFKNINLIFLEHGLGNFLSFVTENKLASNSLKFKIENLISFLFFKLRGIHLPGVCYYYGICGREFNLEKIELYNHKMIFLDGNFKKGFNQIYNFYLRKLQKIKKNRNKKYIFCDVPEHLNTKAYNKYINLIVNKIKYKKNIIVLIKLHPALNKKFKEFLLLKKKLKEVKIDYFIFDNKNIPAEVIIKFYDVREIYSSYTTLNYSIYYFWKKQIKTYAYVSNLVKKKFGNFREFSNFSNNYLVNKKNNKNLSIFTIT